MKTNFTSDKRRQVLREIGAVLEKHGASLFFSVPARLWIDGKEVGQIAHDDGSDGSRLEVVTP